MSRRAAFLLVAFPAVAQTTLEQAVAQAQASYPSIRVSEARLAEAAAGINLARTAYLPRADLFGQVNRATRNNIFGMVLPGLPMPSISGPPKPENDLGSVWGTATGITVSWEPFDFGYRKANVEAAALARTRAELAVERARFDAAVMTADAFLTVLAAEQTLTAAEAGAARTRVLAQQVEALVQPGLRPGADAARARAELALAENQVIQARQAVRTARVTLRELTGRADEALASGALLAMPAEVGGEAGIDQHPAAREQNAAVEEARARRKASELAYYPKFSAQGSSYARGTGANPDGTTRGAASGLGPSIYNYGVGLTVTFPLLDLPALRARREQESQRERAEGARHDELLRGLRARRERARAALDGAAAIARNMPGVLEAARAAEAQAAARYKAGLYTLAEVAEAQRLLTQAEIDERLARLAVWRARLALAAAEGDLRPVIWEGSR
ncbi:MAG: TolC family protein [Bryobacteraceae bacterium]|nr:TolC family protein [Bryobacteraceae bacterium]